MIKQRLPLPPDPRDNTDTVLGVAIAVLGIVGAVVFLAWLSNVLG